MAGIQPTGPKRILQKIRRKRFTWSEVHFKGGFFSDKSLDMPRILGTRFFDIRRLCSNFSEQDRVEFVTTSDMGGVNRKEFMQALAGLNSNLDIPFYGSETCGLSREAASFRFAIKKFASFKVARDARKILTISFIQNSISFQITASLSVSRRGEDGRYLKPETREAYLFTLPRKA
ncbi:hypothetical protein ACFLZ2_05590 [Candidatus Margulisiibacteriota bacterium]